MKRILLLIIFLWEQNKLLPRILCLLKSIMIRKRFLSGIFYFPRNIAVGLLFVLVLFLFTEKANATGVTVITHGQHDSAHELPEWINAMADKIANRAGGKESVAIYTIRIEKVNNVEQIVSVSKVPASIDAWQPGHNGEIIFKVDWTQCAGGLWPQAETSTIFVGKVISDFLLNPSPWYPDWYPLVELPLHLIGHSRGGSVMSVVATYLAQRGVWVDQITLLDPHPRSGEIAHDADISFFNNAIFVDDYYETIDIWGGWFVRGMPIRDDSGRDVAANMCLNTRFEEDGLEGYEHGLVHEWYQGTVDQDAESCIETPPDGPPFWEIPSNWYISSDLVQRTFSFSRIADGQRKRSSTLTYDGMTNNDGLVSSVFGGGTQRSVLNSDVLPFWPNIILEYDEEYTVNTEQTVNIRYRCLDDSQQATIYFYTDVDKNPYNRNEISVGSPITADSVLTRKYQSEKSADFSWTPSINDNNRYVYAKIVNANNARYYYLPERFTIGTVETPTRSLGNDFTRYGSLEWYDSEGDDDGIPEAGETLQVRIGLLNESGVTLENIRGTLSTTFDSIQITDAEVLYDVLGSGSSSYGVDKFKMQANFSSTTNVPFQLRITYTKNGVEYYQDWFFSAMIYQNGTFEPKFVVDHVTWYHDDDSDNIFESGESATCLLYLRNDGNANATEVQTKITNVSELTVTDELFDYPDMPVDSTQGPYGGVGFGVNATLDGHVLWNFSGIVKADIVISYKGMNQEYVIRDYPLFEIQRTKWLMVNPETYNFGVTGTDHDVEVSWEIKNVGSDDLQVTAITSSDGDTTWQGDPLPWTIPIGESKIITVVIETSGLIGNIQRQLTVTSDARTVDSDGSSSKIVITGNVSDAPSIYQIPNIQGDNPDVGGNIIVWEDSRNGNKDVYAYDITTGIETPICTKQGDQVLPKVSDSLIAWMDYASGQGDIYAYNLTTGQEISISTNSADEWLVGVDGNKVAFVRAYSTNPWLWNLYYYDVPTHVTTAVTQSTANDTISQPADAQYDFGSGIITWSEYSTSNYKVKKLLIGTDSSPVEILSNTQIIRGPSTNNGRICWSKEDSGKTQVYVWNGAISQITNDATRNSGYNSPGVAIGDVYVVYDRTTPKGLFYGDVSSQTFQELALLDATVSPQDWRMDKNILVWRDASTGGIYFTFFDSSDLSVSSDDIIFSNENPKEDDEIDVQVNVHNLSKTDSTADITVRLYDGDPDDGGTEIGSRVISGGITGRGVATVTFANVPVGHAPTRNIYTRISVEGDYVINNTSMKNLSVTRLLPTVSITTTDSSVFESSTDSGNFVISRTGDTNTTLTVYFNISGTVIEGSDYVSIGGSVTIPLGFSSTEISIIPIEDDEKEENETIVVTLISNTDYNIGLPSTNSLIILGDTAGNSTPSPPTGLTVAIGNGVVNLNWNNNTESDLAGYNVYRSTISGGSYSKVNTSLLTLSQYSDSGLINSTTYYYVVSAVDTAGNESGYSSQVSAKPMSNPPTASASATPTSGTAPLTVNFTGTGTDDGSITKYEWDFDGNGTYDWSSTTGGNTVRTYSSAGTYTATLRVTDNDNLTGTASVVITVSSPPIEKKSPTASISASSTSGTAPLKVTFTYSGTDADGTIQKYEIDFDGNGTWDFTSTNSGTKDYTYGQSGNYTAILKVTDNDGLSGTATVPISVSNSTNTNPLVADANCNTSALTVGETATLIGAAVGGSGSYKIYKWDYEGDGEYDCASTTTEITHVYDNPGSYSPTVMVVDSNGLTDTDSTSVIVNSPTILKVWISAPKDTDSVWGTNVTLNTNTAPGSITTSVKFQYKVSDPDITTWTDIGNKMFPPPDSFFATTWDVTELTEGNYDLRVVATNTSDNIINSESITVTVTQTDPDVNDGVDSNGNRTKEEQIDKDETTEVMMDDYTSVKIPYGSLEQDATLTVTAFSTNPLNTTEGANSSLTNFRSIKLEDGPSLQKSVTITIPYDDADNDGIVDGTNIPEEDLKLWWYNTGTGEWEKIPDTEIDTTNKRVKAKLGHLSNFAIGSEDTAAPSAPSGLTATAGDGQVSLTWTNPTDTDFTGVKVIRKTGSYPASVTDGTEVYAGTGTGATDTGLTNGTACYYSVFAYDEVPNYSGAGQATATPQGSSGGGGGGGCFIATAVYGTPMAGEVRVLCDFRDAHLLTNPVGRRLVTFYYRVSPPIADFIAKHESLKSMVRFFLNPVVKLVE